MRWWVEAERVCASAGAQGEPVVSRDDLRGRITVSPMFRVAERERETPVTHDMTCVRGPYRIPS